MSLLVVGLSQSTTPLDVLERAVVPADELPGVLARVAELPDVQGALVLSTCNRVEVVVDVPRFHACTEAVSSLLAQRAGLPVDALSDCLVVHWEEAAAQHLFEVAAGLDSMVLGEPQVLGQLRDAYALSQAAGASSPTLHSVVQAALRSGRAVRGEAGLDRAGADLVSVALDAAQEAGGGLAGRRALVVGAGSLGALAGAWLRRRDVGDVVVASRTPERARRLATSLAGRAVGMDALAHELSRADVVVSATGATGAVLSAALLAEAAAGRRARGEGPLVVLDLALPRDVEPSARDVPGLVLVDLASLQPLLAAGGVDRADVGAALVARDVAAWASHRRGERAAPTVVALRERGRAVVDAEMTRLAARLPDLSARERAEVEASLGRVVARLLHAPSVRVKELAAAPGGDAYPDALAELFDLGAPTAGR